MTRITKCKITRRTRTFLRPRMLFYVFSLLSVLGALSLGQIYLRFLSRDLLIETRKLQGRREELQARRQTMLSEVEHLKDYDHVREYAQAALGLRERSPLLNRRGLVTDDCVRRWTEAYQTVASLKQQKTTATEPERVIASLSDKLFDVSTVSMAEER